MSTDRDPVDEALRLLRNETLTNRPNPFLEEKLMNTFDKRSHGYSVLGSRAALCVLLLVVVVGAGVATGGMKKLKSWLVTVEVDGQPRSLELGDNDEKTLSVETADGGTATVQVRTSASAGEQETSVRLEKRSSDELGHDVNEHVRKVRRAGAGPEAFDLQGLGDAVPIKEWSDDDGSTRAVYILPDGRQGSNIVLVTTPVGEEPYGHLVANPSVALTGSGMTPTVTVGGDGSISVDASDDAGEREIALKFMLRTGDVAENLDVSRAVSVQSEDGNFRVHVSPQD